MKENQKYPLNAVRLCIDQTDGEVSGRAYTPLYAGELQFMGLQELLLRLDRIFDESGYPQAFTKKRTFQRLEWKEPQYKKRPNTYLSPQEIMNQQGRKKTYDVIIRTRCNSSWQGILRERDQAVISEFYGELELLEVLLTE